MVEGVGIPNQLAKFNSADTLSSSILTETAINQIGVGLTDPTGGGVVDSIFAIRGVDNKTALTVLTAGHQRRFALNTSSDGGWTMFDGVTGTWRPGLAQRNGNVMIGGSFSGRLTVTAQGDLPAVVGVTSGSGAVVGSALMGTGVQGGSLNGIGVLGRSEFGLAGQFMGDVTVTGTLTKGGGAFQIDHPLDPTNRYLNHSFVESPDMMNVYNGNVALDDSGEAWVALPDWFEALNRDFRYQLTAIGAPGPNLYVASEVSGNRFKIAGGTPAGKVSRQVTGIRQDEWANAHRIAVEEPKPPSQRGTYLHPAEHGQPESALPIARADRRRTTGGSEKH